MSPSLAAAVAQFWAEWLTHQLREHRGNRSQTARAIGITRSYLVRLIREYGISVLPDPATWIARGPHRPPRCGICAELGHNARRHRR